MSSTTTKTKGTEVEEIPEAILELKDRRAKKPPIPKLELDHREETGSVHVSFDADNEMEATAIAMLRLCMTDEAVYGAVIKQIINLGDDKQPASADSANFVLGFIASMEPQDELEALLAAQMAATHQLALLMGRRLSQAQTLPQQDSAEKAFNKLTRTFATQMETLKKYRAKAQQTVRVERVTVEEGGQAVVGNVSHQGGGGGESDR